MIKLTVPTTIYEAFCSASVRVLLILIVCCAVPALGAPVEGSLPIQWDIRGRGLQGISATSIAGPCLRTANFHPA